MAAETLEELFLRCGVDVATSTALVAEGWTLATFRCCASSLEHFDDALRTLVADIDALSLLQKAALRLAFKTALSQDASPVQPSGSEALGMASAPSGSWSETFAPKLEASMIKQLKIKFLQNYPSELLTPETMPSTRLLSLVHHQISKKQWSWVPWRFRMSVSKAEDLSSQRGSKVPRLESLGLHSLLIDEPPALEISNTGMGLNAMRNMFDVHNVAVALCGGAHLSNLKGYTQKFFTFLTQKVDPDSGLRTATILECQAADRQIWQQISDLMLDRNWSMDDALYEFANIRHDLPSLLQLRPKPPKPMAWSSAKGERPLEQKGGKGKGKGKTKGKPVGKGKVEWVTDIHKDGKWQQLCMRFQSGRCSLASCRFVHACAHPRQDNTACGGEHSAFEHKSAPH